MPSDPSSETTSKEDATETKTALIDSAICPGMEPGDEMVLKIDKVMDKEYLVSYSPEPAKEEETPAEEAAPAPGPSGGAMASMME